MSPASTAFYRSRTVRPVFVLTGAFSAWGVSPWGPKPWHDTPSLRFLHAVLPWPIMASGFVIYVLLLLSGRLSAVALADWLGLAMYGTGLVALLVTLRFDRPTNPLAIAAMFLACALHYLAARLATFQLEDV